jgi:hypothetical protein
MLYWGPNVNHMYCLHFCFKALKPPSWLQLPKCSSFKIGLDSLTFSHTCESLFESFSNLLQLSYFYFYCKPKIRSQHWKLTFTHFFNFYLFLSTNLDDFQFFFEMFVFHTSFMNTSIISFSPILFSFLENCTIFNTHKNFHTRKRKNKQSYFLPNSTSLNI